jgi:Phytanoyl-CoA dioxygenase (PhyH)
MLTLTPEQVATFREQGYLLVRAVFSPQEIEALRRAYDDILTVAARPDLKEAYRLGSDRNVHVHIQAPAGVTGPEAVRYLRKVQWPAMFHGEFERIRTSPKWPALLEPLIGASIKQYINQINFKMPGGGIEFPWHQDVRPTPAFRDQVHNYVQTIIAVDDAPIESGCLYVVPGSHKRGNLELKRYAAGQVEAHVDVGTAVACAASAGDVIMFTSYTVHGSQPNRTDRPRRSYINGFVRAASCDVGKWAFLDGRPVPITSDTDYADIRFSVEG